MSHVSATPRPSHSLWFKLDAVDDIERRGLPEFFDGGSSIKTPESYVQMRNFIVNTYREAPHLHLSVTECRRHLAVDVGCVFRLHAFLEHWGLINYSGAIAKPAGAAAPAAAAAAGNGGGAMPVTDLSLRAPLASGGGEWSANETLALIEALDVLGPDAGWDDVAAQVGKSAEECVSHFISLPIEEPHAPVAGCEAADDKGGGTGTADPMLCQLALLSHAVKPPRKRARTDAKAEDAAVADAAMSAAGALHMAARACASGVMARALELRPAEDPTLSTLLASVVDAQVRLVETKLANLDELSSLVTREREQLERLRGKQLLAMANQAEARDGEAAPAAGAASV